MISGSPKCVCDEMICRKEEEYFMNICASDGRTYKSKCEIKRQQCLKQYELVLMYPGICMVNLIRIFLQIYLFG